jgi:hypothetical protein
MDTLDGARRRTLMAALADGCYGRGRGHVLTLARAAVRRRAGDDSLIGD